MNCFSIDKSVLVEYGVEYTSEPVACGLHVVVSRCNVGINKSVLSDVILTERDDNHPSYGIVQLHVYAIISRMIAEIFANKHNLFYVDCSTWGGGRFYISDKVNYADALDIFGIVCESIKADQAQHESIGGYVVRLMCDDILIRKMELNGYM